jgi:formylglycine-generating enzyme required for sulfatase activity
MSRIFLSHSSVNNAEAIAIRDWMKAQGWKDVFLDLDPERGLVAGDRWQAVLKVALDRCELVVVVVSPDWAASSWCKAEFLLAKHGSNPKAILPVIVARTAFSALPSEMTAEYQQVDLTKGVRSVIINVTLPPGDATAIVEFSEEGLRRLKIAIERAGVDASYFDWPPPNDPNRPPYRGLKPLEADDAGIFFGRDAPLIEALDRLRGLREAAPPRLLVILGASGAGKSSFLRAGLLPRLTRDDRHFLPLPIVRPGRAVISGETGFLSALESACRAGGLAKPRAELRAAIDGGAATLRPLLQVLAEKVIPPAADQGRKDERTRLKAPMLVISIDQGEELFLAEGQKEAEPFLPVLRDLLTGDAPAVTAVFTIRSDNYERLQGAKGLEGVRQQFLGLSPMPKGSYAEVIKGPSRRLDGTPRALKIEESLVAELLTDIEDGASKDALPLLAFILERLYVEYGAGGNLCLSQYRQMGGIRGSIEAAVEKAVNAADADPTIPKDRTSRLALLRQGLVPWIAGIDPETGAPRRRVARMSEIPPEAVPLIRRLVEQRLLSSDVTKDGASTIEPVHEALLRHWGLLRQWLKEDTGLLIVMEGVKRAAQDWSKNQKRAAWLTHAAGRLKAAEQLSGRPDLAASLEPEDCAYLVACRQAEARRMTRRMQAVGALAVAAVAGLIAWVKHDDLNALWREVTITGPYMRAQVRPHVLSAAAEQALKPRDSFKECAAACPEMIVVLAGSFMMGSPATEEGRNDNEGPQHEVTIVNPYAVSKFEVTFDDWDACAAYGDCDPHVSDTGFGRGRQPVINVTWDDAKRYAAWLSRMTSKPYRLLTEAEYEYAARAGTQTAYPWGDEIGTANANCKSCGSQWDRKQPAPVGSFAANAFGLHEMQGNVYQWVEDCYHSNYDGAPMDGSAWTTGDCSRHVVRGGSWGSVFQFLRSARRDGDTSDLRIDVLGFRMGRTLSH